MSGPSRAELRLDCGSAERARILEAALGPENGRYLASRVEGTFLVLEGEADSPLSLLHTLDDALACLTAAEKAARAGAERR